jgi:lysophospholipase L1-like esterase
MSLIKINNWNIVKTIYKFHIDAIIFANIMQIIAFALIGLRSFNIFTPIIIFAGIWLIIKHIIIYLIKDKKKSINFQLLNTSLVLSLIGIETLLRLSGVISVYIEKRTYFYRSMYDDSYADFHVIGRRENVYLKSGIDYSFLREPNNEGYSDKNWCITKPDSCVRILALGDSFTEGDGAHKDSTWVKFLERKLHNNHLEFMNAGLCGSDVVFLYNNLENKLLKYNPDIVILCINQSDIEDIIIRGGPERFKNNKIVFNKAPWWEPIYAASHISRLFFRIFYDNKLIPKSQVQKNNIESIEIIKSCLLSFQTLCSKANCSFVCVFHPLTYELKNNVNYLKEIITFCKNNSIQYVNLYDYYIKNRVDKKIYFYYWEKDGHHNANGYKIMADGIYEGLIENEIYLQN